MDVLGGNGDQLGMGAVHVLADDPRAVVEPGVEDDPVAGGEAVDAVAERGDDAGPVRAEDARLRHRREAAAGARGRGG